MSMLQSYLLCAVSLLLVFHHVVASSSLQQCGNSTTYCRGTTTTTTTDVCCPAQHSPTGYGCLLQSSCCMPGPPLLPSPNLPNILIVGDSVSIGYTPFVVAALQDMALVQHGPWDVSNGGAGSTKEGLACLENYLVTQFQSDVTWDVIVFNFGLHNLNGSSHELHEYRLELDQITKRLEKAATQRLFYVLTTPYMPDAVVGRPIVNQLNEIAIDVVSEVAELIDLNGLVHYHCGKLYTSCDWCNSDPCTFHYSQAGKEAQGRYVAALLHDALLSLTATTTAEVQQQ